ncbi:hypothetical protein Bca4012_066466 [Brassica carinata]|uniref:glucan endo-1,3-beta-D-glucosidase n=1 Tax=Brassica carinata TaxID=52824 RepID=A0A8X7VQS1_BRACI|nr:hypothetical protein Bca52824_018772 [Brassica carinata]
MISTLNLDHVLAFRQVQLAVLGLGVIENINGMNVNWFGRLNAETRVRFKVTGSLFRCCFREQLVSVLACTNAAFIGTDLTNICLYDADTSIENVTACIPSTNIAAIAVGSEVLNTTPHVSAVLASALSNIHKALVASNLNIQVKVSSPVSMDIMPKPFPPPSMSTFSPSWSTTVY